MDSPENLPVQFSILKEQVKEISFNLDRKIDLTIIALGSGSIVDNILKDIDFFKKYIKSIILSDLKDIDITKWKDFFKYNIEIKTISGDLFSSSFVDNLNTDLFYANELLGDIPNRFVYKNKGHLYDIRIGIYSKNKLPKLISTQVKNIIKNIYFSNKFPDIFTPEIGKLFSFDIVYRRRIFSKELEYYLRLYPDNSVFAVSDDAIYLIYNLYERLNKGGRILLNDYAFFSFENLHLINNFLREDNKNNNFIRNYYGEFTTEPALEFMFFKLKNLVKKIDIKKTIDLLSVILNYPRELINLDGEYRDYNFFIEKIINRLEYWNIDYSYEKVSNLLEEYIEKLKNIFNNNNWNDYLEKTKELSSITVNNIDNRLSEEKIITLKKILLGYFNEDDHRFLTTIIEK